MKIGTPRKAVSTTSLSGTVPVGIRRTAMSDAAQQYRACQSPRAAAPSDGAAIGEAALTRCGTTSPTKPIAPDTATAPPTPIAIPASSISRTRLRDRFRASARRPRPATAHRARAPARAAGPIPIATQGSAISTSLNERSSSEPSSQVVISIAAKRIGREIEREADSGAGQRGSARRRRGSASAGFRPFADKAEQRHQRRRSRRAMANSGTSHGMRVGLSLK